MDKKASRAQEKKTTNEWDIRHLKDPWLLWNIIKGVQAEGVQGCEDAILCIVNKLMQRKLIGAKPTSSNLLLSDATGAGKDVLMKKILAVVVPQNEYIHRNHLSERAIAYWGTNKLNNYTWDGKVLYLEDPEPELLQGQTFKVLASGQNIGSTVKDQQLIEIEVKGKPVIIVTSMNASINYEGERRWDALRLDTSKELTKHVVKDALSEFEGGKKKVINHPLRQALWYGLQSYEVIFPYAHFLEEYLSDNLVMRTQVHKLIDYIRASAVLHQHQRKKDEQGRLIATLEDYEYGRFVFVHLNDAKGGGLNRDEEEFVKVLTAAGGPLTINEIVSKYHRHTKSWIYDHLELFKEKGLIVENYVKTKSGTVYKDVLKISLTNQVIDRGLPEKDVFRRIIGVSEDGIQDSFPGNPGFSEICKEIDKSREQKKLPPLFNSRVEENQENEEHNQVQDKQANRKTKKKGGR